MEPQDKYKGERCFSVSTEFFDFLMEWLTPEQRFVDPELSVEHIVLMRDGNLKAIIYIENR